MIQINDNDLPITVAEKIITGTKKTQATILEKAIYKGVTGKNCDEIVEKDMFDDDEIREIADHLYAYLREKRVEE